MTTNAEPTVAWAEQITGPISAHGEGPIWLGPDLGLAWVDMFRGDILMLKGIDKVERTHVADVATIIRPQRDGGIVVATDRAVVALDNGLHVTATSPTLLLDSSVRFNDGGCDPDGRFYLGTSANDGSPGRGRLFRLDRGPMLTTIQSDVTVSNGLAWSPSGARRTTSTQRRSASTGSTTPSPAASPTDRSSVRSVIPMASPTD